MSALKQRLDMAQRTAMSPDDPKQTRLSGPSCFTVRPDTMPAPEPRGGHEAARVHHAHWRSVRGVATYRTRAAGGSTNWLQDRSGIHQDVVGWLDNDRAIREQGYGRLQMAILGARAGHIHAA